MCIKLVPSFCELLICSSNCRDNKITKTFCINHKRMTACDIIQVRSIYAVLFSQKCKMYANAAESQCPLSGKTKSQTKLHMAKQSSRFIFRANKH